MAVFDCSAFPSLITERLSLRELRRSDAADVLVFRGDPEVQRYNAPVSQSVADVHELMDELDTEWADRTGICWAVTLKGSDTVIGLFGLHHWSRFHRRAEVGYDLAHAYWGQGIGTEAARAIVEFGFRRMDLNRIYAGTIADNRPSVRLLEKVGFTREGTRRQHSWEDDGTFHDSAMYGLLRDEYVHW